MLLLDSHAFPFTGCLILYCLFSNWSEDKKRFIFWRFWMFKLLRRFGGFLWSTKSFADFIFSFPHSIWFCPLSILHISSFKNLIWNQWYKTKCPNLLDQHILHLKSLQNSSLFALTTIWKKNNKEGDTLYQLPLLSLQTLFKSELRQWNEKLPFLYLHYSNF